MTTGKKAAASRRPVTDPGIEAIRSALEGPVIEVLRHEVLGLRGLPRNAAYDKAMNDPKVLDECLRLFRQRPELFTNVVYDSGKRPVTADHDVLACGRTLAEAVALVVRAAARRYFRAKLDFRSKFQAPPAKQSLMSRVGLALGLSHPPPVKRAPKPHARSEALYQAIREHLRFDWQVLLIPHYTPMNPSVVADLGSRLLDIREAAELQALSAPGNMPRDGRVPLLLDDAKRLMASGKEAIDPEVLWRVVQQMDLARLFPNKTDVNQVRRAVSQVSATHVDVLRALLPVLGGDIRRFTAFLMIAYTATGEQRFKQEFCQSGQAHAARKLAERIAKTEPPPPCLDDMKRVYAALLSTAYVGGVEAGPSRLESQPRLKKALDALGPTSKPMSISG